MDEELKKYEKENETLKKLQVGERGFRVPLIKGSIGFLGVLGFRVKAEVEGLGRV